MIERADCAADLSGRSRLAPCVKPHPAVCCTVGRFHRSSSDVVGGDRADHRWQLPPHRRLMTQIGRLRDINDLDNITVDLVNAARQTLVIGTQ